jgi:hypothetical protein
MSNVKGQMSNVKCQMSTQEPFITTGKLLHHPKFVEQRWLLLNKNTEILINAVRGWASACLLPIMMVIIVCMCLLPLFFCFFSRKQVLMECHQKQTTRTLTIISMQILNIITLTCLFINRVHVHCHPSDWRSPSSQNLLVDHTLNLSLHNIKQSEYYQLKSSETPHQSL